MLECQCAGRKAPCVAQVRGTAAQFLGNGAGRRWRLGDDALQPLDGQLMSKPGTEIVARAQRRGLAVAARQVVVEEWIDGVFVELLDSQATARHPV